METTYAQLLESTLQHVEDLKRQGVQHLPVSLDTLASLDQAPVVAHASKAIANPIRPAKDAAEAAKYIARHTVEQKPVQPAADISSDKTKRPDGKAAAIAELRERAIVCQKCPHLVQSRKNVVFGVGSITASLMFVGEAPGADEDEQGEPFVGKAGQLLTRIIETMGLTRQTVYIANILKCRPDTPEKSSGNRKPTAGEMETCLPYLLAQIEIIQPKIIVALGSTAVEGLLGNKVGITKLRGNFQEFHGVPVMPTYHPSYLLRNQSLNVKREVWEDMLQVLETLKMPISEKQRNYFLKN